MQGTAPVFLRPRGIREERLRLRVADGGQRLALENEADRGGHRRFAFELRHSRHGHELGAVLMIEPGGYLDFLRLSLRRDRDAEQMLGEMHFLPRRRDEVEPQRSGGVCGRRMRRQVELGRYEAAVFPPIGAQHGPLRQHFAAAVLRDGS